MAQTFHILIGMEPETDFRIVVNGELAGIERSNDIGGVAYTLDSGGIVSWPATVHVDGLSDPWAVPGDCWLAGLLAMTVLFAGLRARGAVWRRRSWLL